MPNTKKTKSKSLDKVVASTSSTSSTARAYKKKGSKEPKEPLRPIDESEDEESENDKFYQDKDGLKDGTPLPWSKKENFELIKRIRKALKKDDVINYQVRVSQLNWNAIQFKDYSATQCKNRWFYIEVRPRVLTVMKSTNQLLASEFSEQLK